MAKWETTQIPRKDRVEGRVESTAQRRGGRDQKAEEDCKGIPW